MKTIYLIFLLILLTKIFCYAQDINFSQFNNVPLLINPSLAGEYQGNGRFILNYRNQWRSITNNSYKTFSFSTDFSFFNDRLSTGLFIYKDVAGEGNMSLTQINIPIASKIKINSNNFFKLGIQAAWSQKQIEISKLTWNNQFDGNSINPDINSGEVYTQNSFNYFDFSTGVLWTHKMSNREKYNIGFSAFHVNKPAYDFLVNDDKIKMRWCGHADISIPIIPKQLLAFPSILIMKQGPSNEVNFGTIFKYNLGNNSRYTGFMKSSSMFFGAFYRFKDAIIPYARFEFRNQFNICFTYDINISNLIVASNARGGIEISLLYIIPEKALVRL